ncbi:MAG: S1/P1 nuclease [Candidatus Eremiobacteraeota bacterium]|nr:S1/P1 nuclease [Candidatus Eremiobacteraeota bacterium]MCW5867680.1 S1/P1 nuclease [Candidatus Eremiobacteraeota bacterium]
MNALGHMLVARVAWDHLTPAARAAVERLSSNPHNPGAGKDCTDQDNDVYTAAVWMDDVRPTYRDLHYVNTPLEGDGTLPSGPNSITFLNQNLGVLRDSTASEDQKAEALRITEHLVGDLHQPLHNADNHDHGGNDFKLNGRDNLHSFWDSGGKQWSNLKRPLSGPDKQQVERLAAQLEKQYPLEKYRIDATNLQPEDWSREGWELARDDVYAGVTPGQAPSPEYTERARHDMSREAALGGYRLAGLLNQIFT